MKYIAIILTILFSQNLSYAQESKSSDSNPKQNACTNDIQKYCKDVSNGSRAAIVWCLSQNEKKLSKDCKKLREGKKPKQDVSPEVVAKREKIQLMILSSCRDYLVKYCSGDEYSLPWAKFSCLNQQKDLSKECKDTLEKIKEMGAQARKTQK